MFTKDVQTNCNENGRKKLTQGHFLHAITTQAMDLALLYYTGDTASKKLATQHVDLVNIYHYPYFGIGDYRKKICCGLMKSTRQHPFILLQPLETQPVSEVNQRFLEESQQTVCVLGLWTTLPEREHIRRHLLKFYRRRSTKHFFMLAKYSSSDDRMSSFSMLLKDFYCNRLKLFATLQK